MIDLWIWLIFAAIVYAVAYFHGRADQAWEEYEAWAAVRKYEAEMEIKTQR